MEIINRNTQGDSVVILVRHFGCFYDITFVDGKFSRALRGSTVNYIDEQDLIKLLGERNYSKIKG